jgi:hypothetical protein
MSDGQLALNTNLASPGLFFKDSNGDSIKVGPVHVGTTAPNVSPGVGGQAGNSKGEQWLDTSSSRYVFKIWDGTAWRTEDGEFVNASGDLMTGALGIIAGTAAAPGLYFSGDTNTGLWSPAADTLAISTAGTERMRIRSDGNIGIGGAGAATVTLYNQGSITGGILAFANFTLAAVQSDVTSIAYLNRSQATTAAATFTLGNIINYSASITTLGAGSAVTNVYGYWAEPSLGSTSAAQITSVFGFRGEIASATGRWNFYANGTAPNYFAGDVRSDTVVTARTAPANSNVTATATASSLLDGLRTGTPTANINLTLPTGTDMDAAFQELQTNQSFEWSVINLAAATHIITVVANTAHTVVGNMDVAAASSGRFLTRKTTANTFISYRIG